MIVVSTRLCNMRSVVESNEAYAGWTVLIDDWTKRNIDRKTTPYYRDLKISHPEVDAIYVLINIKVLTINLTCWSVAAQKMQFSQVAPF